MRPNFTTADSTRVNFEDTISVGNLKALAEDAKLKFLQTCAAVSDATWERLNTHFFAVRPDVQLRVYGRYSEAWDLSFIAGMTNVRRFAADCINKASNVESIAALRNLAQLSIGIYELDNFRVLERVPSGLTELSLGATRSKRPDLAPLARFSSLHTLHLDGQSRNIEVLATLPNLADLTLRSITTAGLSYLQPLQRLWSLDIKLGGIKSFSGVEGKESIKYLELWQVRGLAEVEIVNALPGIQNLFLQSLPHVTQLPSFRSADHLRRVTLENMKGLTDFSQLEWAPVLEDFALIDGKSQKPNHLIPVLRNPSVQRLLGGFANQRQNQEFLDLMAQYNKPPLERWHKFEYR